MLTFELQIVLCMSRKQLRIDRRQRTLEHAVITWVRVLFYKIMDTWVTIFAQPGTEILNHEKFHFKYVETIEVLIVQRVTHVSDLVTAARLEKPFPTVFSKHSRLQPM